MKPMGFNTLINLREEDFSSHNVTNRTGYETEDGLKDGFD